MYRMYGMPRAQGCAGAAMYRMYGLFLLLKKRHPPQFMPPAPQANNTKPKAQKSPPSFLEDGPFNSLALASSVNHESDCDPQG